VFARGAAVALAGDERLALAALRLLVSFGLLGLLGLLGFFFLLVGLVHVLHDLVATLAADLAVVVGLGHLLVVILAAAARARERLAELELERALGARGRRLLRRRRLLRGARRLGRDCGPGRGDPERGRHLLRRRL